MTERSAVPNIRIIAVCVVYLALSCWHIWQPGLEYDEVLFANAALGHKDNSFLQYFWHVGRHEIPVMLMPYIGALKAWLYMPLLRILPGSAATVRIPMVVIGLLTLLISYKLTFRLFGRRPAFIAALLIATDPTYIFQTRLDWGPVALMMILKTGSLYLLTRFVQTRRLVILGAAAFFIGLGIFDKANFSWYVIALPIAAVLTWRKECLQFVSFETVAVAFTSFMIGSAPLMVYNAVSSLGTLRAQLRLMGHSVNPFPQLEFKTRVILSTFNGDGLYSYINNGNYDVRSHTAGDHLMAGGTLLGWVLLTAVVMLIIRAASNHRVIYFLLYLTTLMLLQIYVTNKAGGPHHVMMLYPFIQIIIAYAYSSSASSSSSNGNRRLKQTILMGMLVLLVTSNVAADIQYLQSFSRLGGQGIWSDAIYDLAEYVQHNRDKTYVLMDWGFNTQILLTSKGRAKKVELFWDLLDGREEALIASVHKYSYESDVFVFHVDRYTQYEEPRRIFEGMLKQYDLQAEVVKVFSQKSGDPVYILKKVKRPFSATTVAGLSPK